LAVTGVASMQILATVKAEILEDAMQRSR